MSDCPLAVQFPKYVQEQAQAAQNFSKPESPSSSAFGKKGARIEEMMKLFKQVQINLPLLDAIKQVLAYAKFLKDLCTQKRKLKTHIPKTIHLTEQPTEVILQLADCFIKVPRGFIEDVLVKVDELYFPVDFLVLDMETPTNGKPQSIIFGRPFLATANEECFSVDVMDEGVAECTLMMLADDPLKQCLTFSGGDGFDIDAYTAKVNALLDAPTPQDCPSWTIKYESLLPLVEKPPLSSVESPPVLELKPLPDSLKYVFLGSNEMLPVIIASNLTSDQESQLLSVLKEHKAAIEWSVAD
ncbi:uncharacterized protein LOC122650719 [Telopea speciosissima]|uniref:uncharacterized protein LOC122650719 n=1 Tax=Telopea speciosissima TaxID=54955 RepID=UPI001CC4C5F8|nr:uncharacterized protein LOC122650719 [Telopea speciosissima]